MDLFTIILSISIASGLAISICLWKNRPSKTKNITSPSSPEKVDTHNSDYNYPTWFNRTITPTREERLSKQLELMCEARLPYKRKIYQEASVRRDSISPNIPLNDTNYNTLLVMALLSSDTKTNSSREEFEEEPVLTTITKSESVSVETEKPTSYSANTETSYDSYSSTDTGSSGGGSSDY
jgi:hypothetical protein